MPRRPTNSPSSTIRVTREQIRDAVAAVRAENKGKKHPRITSAADTASGRGAITFRYVRLLKEAEAAMHVGTDAKPAIRSKKPKARRTAALDTSD